MPWIGAELAMEGLDQMDEVKFRKATVSVLEEYKINDPRDCCTKLWSAILTEQGKLRPKRKSGKSNWDNWSKKKLKGEDEKEAGGMPKPAAEILSPQKGSQLEEVINSELGEAAQSEMPMPEVECFSKCKARKVRKQRNMTIPRHRKIHLKKQFSGAKTKKSKKQEPEVVKEFFSKINMPRLDAAAARNSKMIHFLMLEIRYW